MPIRSYGMMSPIPLGGGHASLIPDCVPIGDRALFRRTAVIVAIGLLTQVRLTVAQDRYAPPPLAVPAAGNGAPAADTPSTTVGNSPATAAGSSNLNSAQPANGASNPFRGGSGANSTASRSTPFNGMSAPPAVGGAGTVPTSSLPNYPSAPSSSASGQEMGTGLKPSAMMRAILSPRPGSQLRGQPLALHDTLAGARSRSEQSQRVEAYWDLCSSVADYYLSLRELEEVANQRRYLQSVDSSWEQVEREMSVRVGTSLRAALASQYRLASLLGRTGGALPLPADSLHCASYSTNHEQIFPGGASAEANELAALLPLRYAELKYAALAVTRAEDWLRTVASRSGNADITGNLHALELLAMRRRAFVQIARDYNRRIVRYSELATPGQVSAVRLTSMLINTAATSTATRPGSEPPRNRQSNIEPAPLPTFVKGSTPIIKPMASSAARDETVQPVSASPADSGAVVSPFEERSLLVPAHE